MKNTLNEYYLIFNKSLISATEEMKRFRLGKKKKRHKGPEIKSRK